MTADLLVCATGCTDESEELGEQAARARPGANVSAKIGDAVSATFAPYVAFAFAIFSCAKIKAMRAS